VRPVPMARPAPMGLTESTVLPARTLYAAHGVMNRPLAVGLRAEGALTPQPSVDVRDALGHLGGDPSVLDVSCLLGILTEIEAVQGGDSGRAVADTLVAFQLPDGGWPASSSLTVPPQHPETQPTVAEAPRYADLQRLFTTATALRALVRWGPHFHPGAGPFSYGER